MPREWQAVACNPRALCGADAAKQRCARLPSGCAQSASVFGAAPCDLRVDSALSQRVSVEPGVITTVGRHQIGLSAGAIPLAGDRWDGARSKSPFRLIKPWRCSAVSVTAGLEPTSFHSCKTFAHSSARISLTVVLLMISAACRCSVRLRPTSLDGDNARDGPVVAVRRSFPRTPSRSLFAWRSDQTVPAAANVRLTPRRRGWAY